MARGGLFGRTQEQDDLRGWLDNVQRGDGAAVLITGAAGIGKTALGKWMRSEALRRGFAVGWGTSGVGAFRLPYGPWIEVFEDLGIALPWPDAADLAMPETILRWAGLRSDAWKEAVWGFAEQLVFAPGMPPEAKSAALQSVFDTPREVLVESWHSLIEHDQPADLARVGCPLLHLQGSFPADLDRVAELCGSSGRVRVPGAGHFIQLTAPAAVNAAIDQFLAEELRPLAGSRPEA